MVECSGLLIRLRETGAWVRIPHPPPAFALRASAGLRQEDGRNEIRVRLRSEALAKEGWFREREMFYVYLIRSKAFPKQRYIGFTTDLKKRIDTHNAGGSVHTSRYKPWKLISYHAFSEKRRAQEFEYYLKTGSGKAFANKRFW